MDPDKIVKHKEVRAITRRLLAEHLTLREKFILHGYDRPVSGWHGVQTGLKLAFNARAREAMMDKCPDGTMGVYHEADKRPNGNYIRASVYLDEVRKSMNRMKRFPETIRKIAAIQKMAVEQARDYRPEVASGKIRPLVIPVRKP